MKLKRFLEEQVIGILKETDAGAVAPDAYRKPKISSATFYAWKSKYVAILGCRFLIKPFILGKDH